MTSGFTVNDDDLRRAVLHAKARAMFRDMPLQQGMMRVGCPPNGAQVVLCPPRAVEVEWLLQQTGSDDVHFRFEGTKEEATYTIKRAPLLALLQRVKQQVLHAPVMDGQCFALSLWNDGRENATAGRFPSLGVDAVTLNVGLLTKNDPTTIKGISAHEAGHIVENHAVRSVAKTPPKGGPLTRAQKEFEADRVAVALEGPEVASRHIALRLNHPKETMGFGQWWMKRHPELEVSKKYLDPLRMKLAVDALIHSGGTQYPTDAERLARNFGMESVDCLIAPTVAKVMKPDRTTVIVPETFDIKQPQLPKLPSTGTTMQTDRLPLQPPHTPDLRRVKRPALSPE